jgi:hypothetical protein
MDIAPAPVAPHRLVLKAVFIAIYRFNTTPSAGICQILAEYRIPVPRPTQSGKQTSGKVCGGRTGGACQKVRK